MVSFFPAYKYAYVSSFFSCQSSSSQGFSGSKESACQAGELGSIPLGQEDPLEKEIAGNPLQYSCLGNPMDKGTWWATVHGVAKELDMT